MTSPNPALLARLKASIFKNRGALGAGAVGAVTGAVVGVATGGGMSPTKPDENNQGNRNAPAPTPMPSTPSATPTPEDIRGQIKTPPLTGAGEGDISKYLKDILPLVTEARRQGSQISLNEMLTLLQATEQAGIQKTREMTARQIELENIKSWRDITTAQINRDSAMGLGLAEIAFRGTQANPGVLTALAPFTQAGVQAFK